MRVYENATERRLCRLCMCMICFGGWLFTFSVLLAWFLCWI